MHRFRSWTLDPPEWRTQRNRLLPIEGGDGSTLSLDFTTGVLDPRITFTRASNATFINSSGLVEWANANMYWNTAFEGLSGTNPVLGSGTGWSYAFSTGNAVFNGDGTITVTTTASERRALQRSAGFLGATLRVIVSVDATIHSGSLQAGDILFSGSSVNAAHYVNGVLWNSSHPIWNGGILPTGTQFNISFAVDTNTSPSSTGVFFGVGCLAPIAGSATFSNPRWTMWKGSGSVPYYQNTSATNNSTANYYKSNDYQAPRFDYDPTSIGTPRGLLIEASAVNLATYSSDFSNAIWQLENSSAFNPSVSSVSQSAPDGSASVNRIIFNKTGGTFSRVRQTLSGTASQTYTLSVWMKANTASGGAATQNVGLRIGADTVGFNCVVTTTWKRFQYSYALSGTNADAQIMLWDNIVGNDETADVLVWGAQLELGSGASSYIPTGASTAQRAADACAMTGTNFTNWFNASSGTLLVDARTATKYVDSIGFDFPAVLTVDSNNHIGPSQYNGIIYGVLRSGGLYRLNYVTLASPGDNAAYKAAIAYADSDYAAAANGGSVSTSSTGTVPAGLNQLAIGASRAGVAGNFFGHIRQIKFWPTRLPNANLQSLTT